ncbi:MAG: hypothetical protein Q4B85_13970, partial [Lachnospiraceae bacterium]|nr:hypothetical protein [Lachnospiraceae bacterium]
IHSFTGLEKTIQNTYESYPESSKAYIQPINVSDDSFTQMWMQIPYERKMISEEYTTFLTNNGERVRSKSELTIANALYKRKIPYKYECPLRLDKYSVIYPDFTILNSRTRKVIYWEHRGMMDDRDYARHAVKRMKDYQSAGICIGKDLIITEETVNYPLGTNEIDWIIDNYLV